MQKTIESFKSFVDASPTSYHTVEQIREHLNKNQFIQLDETQLFHLENGKGYYIIRGGSLIAFRLPKNTAKRLLIIGSHTDSPALKLKPYTLSNSPFELGGIEVYGSAHLPSWTAQDLKLAGRIFIQTQEGVQEQLVDLANTPCVIANAPVHLDSPNQEGFRLDPETHLRPILGLKKELDYLQTLFKGKILAHDLFFVPCDPMRFLGVNHELISSYRLDNLSSVFPMLMGLMQTQARIETLQIALFSDHEEIGSGTEEGAASPFFFDTLRRICIGIDLSEDAFFALKARSFCLSLDAAHAFHPNYASLYSQEHAPKIANGVVVKVNASRRYATHGKTQAQLMHFMDQQNIAHQIYVNHASKRCGSTIGHIFASQTGIPTVDIGVPLLGMHSIREQISKEDLISLCNLCKLSYEQL